MTEEEACRIYASAWNRLSPDDLVTALDEHVRYSSQSVFSDVQGKEQVAEYFRNKMATIRSTPGASVFAQLAETQPYPMYPNPPRPCVVVAQGNPEDLVATVLFTVSTAKIVAIDMCLIPPPHTVRLLGEFPS